MAGTVSVDAMLADAIKKLDGLNSRMDALETGQGGKNPIKHDTKKADDDDDDKKDDAAAAKSDDDDDKKDDATTPKNKILDDDDDDKKDDAASKADAKKGDDGELEIKHGEKKSDAKKADAKKADAKKADDDDKKDDAEEKEEKEKEEKEDSARADAVTSLQKQIADQAVLINRLQAMMKPRSDDEHAAFADAQARADAVFAGFGQRASRPLEGESLVEYRKRLATKLKGYSNTWKKAKFARMDDDTFEIAEAAIYADATAAATSPVDLKAGELRMVTKIDPTTGVRTNVFYGNESFVKGMGRPGRRVASFRTLASQ